MPAYPTRVSLHSDAVAAPPRNALLAVNQVRKTSGPKPDFILSASAGGRTPCPPMIAGAPEPPGVCTRRLPASHRHYASA